MIRKLLKIAPVLLLLIISVVISHYWLTHSPRAERKSPETFAPLVEVMPLAPVEHQTSIYAMGSVIAAESVNLTPRISGMVQWVSPNFIEGGMLKKDDVLVELDPTDYKLAIVQSQNDLAKAEYNLKLEQGQQAIVKREFELLGADLKDQERELVLRKPHLTAAKASVSAAKAALRQAQLNLERTRPLAPFNSIIISRNANVGAWMSAFSTGTPLAKLVGVDHFWINVSVPVDQLNWIHIPGINSQTGAVAKITYESAWGKGVYRLGEVKRLQAELEPEGRMAKLIVEVADPLCQKAENKNLPPLMLGTYVRVEIEGSKLTNVFKLPESSLHEGQQVWLMTDQQKLDIKSVKSVWKQDGYVYLKQGQLNNDAEVVISDLATPVQGMQIRLVQPHQPSQKINP